jgi:phosphoglycolate phosphatase-like HAD superfamily hydrolase
MSANPKALSRPHKIIFDLDGTLTTISERAARISSVSDKWNLPVSSTTHWLMRKANQIYNNIGIQSRFIEAARQDMLDLLCAEKKDMFVVLQTAFDRDISCSLLSNGPRKWGENTLNRLQIRAYFDHVLFREDVPHLKPAPDALLSLLGKSNAKDNETIWVVGDRTADVYLALNANAASDCNVVPVALKGTKAANTIIALRDKFNVTGHVFDTPHDMACALDPDLENRITEVTNRLGPTKLYLASYRIQ